MAGIRGVCTVMKSANGHIWSVSIHSTPNLLASDAGTNGSYPTV